MAEAGGDDDRDDPAERRRKARQRQIDIGKARSEYKKYEQQVRRDDRTEWQPSTPNPSADVSKRKFDRQLSEWRRRLHEYDDAAHPSGYSGEDVHMFEDSAQTFAEKHVAQRPVSHASFPISEKGGPVPLRLDALLEAVVSPPLLLSAASGGQQSLIPSQLRASPGMMQRTQLDRPGRLELGAASPASMIPGISPITPETQHRRSQAGQRVSEAAMTPECPPRHEQRHKDTRLASPRTPQRKPPQAAQAVGSEFAAHANSPPCSGNNLPRTPLNLTGLATGRTPSPVHTSEIKSDMYPYMPAEQQEWPYAAAFQAAQALPARPPSWAGALW